jgi:nucleotide-binding universal stress UspA family protein
MPFSGFTMINQTIMKKILFPFETLNPIYKEAYVYAVKLARNLNTEVILLNTFLIEAGDDITEEKYGKLIRDNWFKAYNEISKFNKYFLEDHARIADELTIKFDYRFVHGIFQDEIRNIAREEDVSLIVLPLSDRKEINKRQLEIIRDNIFEKNRVSLMVIPFQGAFKPIKNIVFATDLHKVNHYKQYLDDVIHYAKALDSNIHFLHISTRENSEIREDSKEYQMIMQVIEQNKRHVFKRVFSKDVIESVKMYVEDNNADLLVVVKQQHYFLDTLFHKSFSNDISLNSKIPVLVMREIED